MYGFFGEFVLTRINSGLRLIVMDKEEIKSKLLEAVKSDSHLADIKSVALFGSYLTDQTKADSDIDVLIDFVPTAKIGYFELAQIKRNLEAFSGKTVDLLTPPAISKFFRAEVLQQAECFYEK